MKYISGCVCLGKKAGIYSLVKGLPPLKHTITRAGAHTHFKINTCECHWVPVDVTYPCEREATGQTAKGMHGADPRWVLSGCSCLKLGKASIEQVPATAAGGVIDRCDREDINGSKRSLIE